MVPQAPAVMQMPAGMSQVPISMPMPVPVMQAAVPPPMMHPPIPVPVQAPVIVPASMAGFPTMQTAVPAAAPPPMVMQTLVPMPVPAAPTMIQAVTAMPPPVLPQAVPTSMAASPLSAAAAAAAAAAVAIAHATENAPQVVAAEAVADDGPGPWTAAATAGGVIDQLSGAFKEPKGRRQVGTKVPRWSPDQDERLRELVGLHGDRGKSWEVIAGLLEGGRTPTAVEQHYHILIGKRRKSGGGGRAAMADNSALVPAAPLPPLPGDGIPEAEMDDETKALRTCLHRPHTHTYTHTHTHTRHYAHLPTDHTNPSRTCTLHAAPVHSSLFSRLYVLPLRVPCRRRRYQGEGGGGGGAGGGGGGGAST